MTVRQTPLLAGFSIAVLTLGCSRGPEYVPVSGQVTLDGKPLAGAVVIFQPVARSADDAGGFGSSGKTDSDGRYTLRVAGPSDNPGALVGNHRVSITTRTSESPPGSDEIKPLKGGERVPARFNSESILTLEVPPGGTTSADFTLTSR